MTTGAIILMSIESGTVTPKQSRATMVHLNARDCVKLPPLQNALSWKSIIIHSSKNHPSLSKCHFIISGNDKNWTIHTTDYWEDQKRSHQLINNYQHINSIGIGIIGDFSTVPPTDEQMHSLLTLVTELQKTFRIDTDSVYLQKELDPNSNIPGPAFPITEFNSNLLRLEDK